LKISLKLLNFPNFHSIVDKNGKRGEIMPNGFKRIATTSERIKEAMKATGKKQIDLCRETGIDKGSVSHYVSGRYEPKQDAIYKLASALDVSEMWLWGYDAPMARPQMQKNNDAIADIVLRLQADETFLDFVKAANELPPEKLSGLLAFLK
jgi:transcriptional regulator with XRE-family HTH domain